MSKTNYVTEFLSKISNQKENINKLYSKKEKFADNWWKIGVISLAISSFLPFLLIVGLDVERLEFLKNPKIFWLVLGSLFFTSAFITWIGISLDERNRVNKVAKLNEIDDALFLKLKEDKTFIKELSFFIIDDASKDLFLQIVRSLALENNKEASLDLFYQLINYKEKQQNIQKQKDIEATTINKFLSDIDYNEPTVIKQQVKEKFLGML